MSEKINLINLEKEVNKLVEQRLVARIRFRGITPWWGGDYEGKTSGHVDEDEIIGRLRWFLRTVYNRFCATNLNSYAEAEKFVSQYLGSTNSKSLYTIKTSNTQPTKSNCTDLPRIRLFAQGERNKPNSMPVNIRELIVEIYRNKKTEFDEIIIDSLIITLAFLGVGKGVNRGFGRFIPDNCAEATESVCDKVLNGDVKGAFKEFYTTFKRVTNCNRNNVWYESAVPVAPLPEGDSSDAIKVISCNTNVCGQLEAIQKAVMKSTFKTCAFNTKITDEGGYIHTFILGLPRHSKVTFKTNVKGYNLNVDPQNLDNIIRKYFQLNNNIKTDKEGNKYKPLNGITGYYGLRGVELAEIRRQSMYIISPFKDKILILPFLSLLDHEMEVSDIVHIGVHTNYKIADRIKVLVRPVTSLMNESGLSAHERQLASRNKNLSAGGLKQLIENYTNALQIMIRCWCR
ncbi:type III-B CRISPR module RAMP protein Cmr1 [Sulfurisphaera ohwakuensis]|uniref:CRISPR type III-B/RAMP module RAMP protein Cmr1 n=1 Tax=Sulfurisphaera ohwakuensis TaxID=69656 RepID=A0A650CKB5_SULOH|nr:type III-B CRISPR module RAMP protein Cmr1 [Sulfurisphaera ohwakuensis]MBB5254875.1 CRISPR type III-B/RAMP module RAMP protein Cmr1 [Sulfurisphaera ohwakuensis]QGR18276.1 type III-B CRISPR module RAMP protein Cmr1 [Sulfurisphaera ohwakuensis]